VVVIGLKSLGYCTQFAKLCSHTFERRLKKSTEKNIVNRTPGELFSIDKVCKNTRRNSYARSYSPYLLSKMRFSIRYRILAIQFTKMRLILLSTFPVFTRNLPTRAVTKYKGGK
jgi:hypothetical protein